MFQIKVISSMVARLLIVKYCRQLSQIVFEIGIEILTYLTTKGRTRGSKAC
jgi:hypothetical protein